MPTPRERLVDAARSLFYGRGLPSVGINEVTDSAGVAKMTLYNNFKSKEELALAAFEAEAASRRQAIDALQAKQSRPSRRILALFTIAERIASRDGFRGCAFINLALEAAAPEGSLHGLARAHKAWIRDNILSQLAEGGCGGQAALADQIVVLWDGAIVGAYVQQSVRPIKAARAAARALLDAAGVP